jgi:hypothetical protein
MLKTKSKSYMIINRRQFVQTSLFVGTGMMIDPFKKFLNPKASSFFGVHPFILQNPEAVFIMRTDVDMKTNSSAIKAAGLDFGRSVFGLTDDAENGIPLTHKVVIKPNLTCRARNHASYTITRSMGIVTDANFVEGIIESLKELGISAGQFYIREVNCPEDLADGGYINMAERTGIDLQGIDIPASELSADKIQWIDVPDGVWFKKIPYLWPVNAPDTWLLNIAKFKTHGMGLTLCAKNLQGTIAMNYQAHCTSYGETMYGVNADHICPTANIDIMTNYSRHLQNGIPRWDRPGGDTGGLWQETWATRCLDNNSVIFAGLHIIEGIYGRDGNFMDGPNSGGLASDYMTNYIIFGRNAFHVDIIGHYLAGHEPGNFGLFHMAKERGMSSTINPMEIPVYKWEVENGAIYADLNSFQRYPLKTYYLQRDYGGQSEPYWHMVDEPYNYSTTSVIDLSANKDNFFMEPAFPNPIKNTATFNFHIPENGRVTIVIINDRGRIVDIPLNRQLNGGDHTIFWNSNDTPSGLYISRIYFNNFTRIQKILVVH